MKAHADWYGRIEKEVGPYRDSLGKKMSKRYKLDLLLRIARRVSDFSAGCGNC